MSERTLSIIKPDAVERNLIGAIAKMIEEEGLRIVALKKIRLSKEKAQGFYYVHKDRPFFDSLTEFMCSGPCVVMILEGDNAIARYRKLMGATNPENAEPGTIRKLYAQNVERNSVHGSDAPETAAFETSYFFSQMEITG